MKYYIGILTILFIGSCSNNKSSEHKESSEINLVKEDSVDWGWNYKVVGHEKINELMKDICTSQALEFNDLYPTLDSIADDQYESLILLDSLKLKGFKVIKRGRGNWTDGPRIVSFTISDGQCECRVDKLYYSTETDGEFKVTERIKCN